jgi:hypothetical protein
VDVSKRCKQSCKKKRLQRSKGLFHEGIPFREVYTQLLLRRGRLDCSTLAVRIALIERVGQLSVSAIACGDPGRERNR